MYLNPLLLHPNKKQVGPGYVRATQTNQILTLGRKGTTTIKNTSYIVPGEREREHTACMYVLALFANPGPGGQILHLNSIQPLADSLTCCYYYYQKTIAAVNSFTGHSLKRLQGGETIIKLIRPWEEAFKSMVIPCKAAATCISDNIGKNSVTELPRNLSVRSSRT